MLCILLKAVVIAIPVIDCNYLNNCPVRANRTWTFLAAFSLPKTDSMNWFWANWYHVNAGVAVVAFSILDAYWNHFDLV